MHADDVQRRIVKAGEPTVVTTGKTILLPTLESAANSNDGKLQFSEINLLLALGQMPVLVKNGRSFCFARCHDGTSLLWYQDRDYKGYRAQGKLYGTCKNVSLQTHL